jgi:hypothetical protein
MQSELEELRDVERTESATTKPRGILAILGLALIWAILAAAVVGSLAAAVWTVIPTEMLEWGATTPNLIGYISHCSYSPVSTAILLAAAGIGALLSYKLKRSKDIAFGVFVGTAGGLFSGLLGGVDITMFIGMGAGVGVGVFLGILIGVLKRNEV